MRRSALFILVALLGLLLAGCPDGGGGGQPEVTITVTDCPVANITVAADATSVARSGGQWRISAEVTVKCDGNPVKDAQIKAEFWWPGGTFVMKTNESGVATYARTVQADPKGQTYTATVTGTDGDKAASFTFP